MKWWLIGGGAALLLGVLWYFGIAKAARAVLGFFADGLTDFREWIRKPGSKLKTLCGLMALCFVMASLQSFQRSRQIVRIQTEYVAYRQQCEVAANQCKLDIGSRDQRIADFVRIAGEERAKLDEVERQGRTAAQDAAKARAEAARTQAKYDVLFRDKPATCAAALTLMQSECQSLRDY